MGEDADVGLAHPVFVREEEVREGVQHAVTLEQSPQDVTGRIACVRDHGELVALSHGHECVHDPGDGLGRDLEDEALEGVDGAREGVVGEAHAEGGERRVEDLARRRRAPLVMPHAVEVVVAGRESVGDGGFGEVPRRRDATCRRRAGLDELGMQSFGPPSLAFALTMVGEESVPEVQRDGL